jgi:hypothetical protein
MVEIEIFLYDAPRYLQYHCYGTHKTRYTREYPKAFLGDVVLPALLLPLVPALQF